MLRDANAAAVAELVRIGDMTHAQINAELNRLVGIQRVGEATSMNSNDVVARP